MKVSCFKFSLTRIGKYCKIHGLMKWTNFDYRREDRPVNCLVRFMKVLEYSQMKLLVWTRITFAGKHRIVL